MGLTESLSAELVGAEDEVLELLVQIECSVSMTKGQSSRVRMQQSRAGVEDGVVPSRF